MAKRTCLHILTWLVMPAVLSAQKDSPAEMGMDSTAGERKDLYLQLAYHGGVYWSRTAYLANKFADGYRAMEARFGLQTEGRRAWERYHQYPRYGVGIHYADLVADPEDTIIGNPFSGYFFYSAPWARVWKFSLNSDLALGLSYSSLVHDPLTNPFNDVIASHLNLFFDFNMNVRFAVTRRFDIHAGYGVTHYSNGRIHQPQKGINNWGWNAGMSFHLSDPGPPVRRNQAPSEIPGGPFYEEPAVRDTTVPEPGTTLPEPGEDRTGETPSAGPDFASGEQLQLFYGAGVVEHQRLGDVEGVHYFTSSFTADYAVTFNPRMAVSVGTDVLYDGSLAIAIKGIPPEEVTTFQKFYFGSHLGYHFLIDRVTILFNLGTYFLSHSYDRGAWFMRAGGRVRLSDHLHGQICIKTKNGVRADWIEWGVACTLDTRN